MRSIAFFLGSIFLLLIAACNETPKHQAKAKPATVIIKKTVKIQDSVAKNTVTIAAVGDIMLGTSYPNSKTLPPDSARGSFKNVAAQLQSADVTFGNLEGTLLDTGVPAYYKLHQLSKSWMFRMPVSYAKVLRDAGFDVLSLANNHIGDFGDKGRQSTIKVLDSLGLYHGGQVSRPYSIFKRNGIIYGFCAFAPNSYTLSIFNLKYAAKLIKKLKNECDIVIVSFHGGGEGVFYEHVPCMNESFNREKRGDVHAFAHNAVDAGADLVLGNGPHVCRGMELYHNRLIAYSLGNFCTYRCVSVSGICGYAPLLKANLSKNGAFVNGEIVSAIQSHDKGLVIDSANHAANRIRNLTISDFEQPGLKISAEGYISPIEPVKMPGAE